MSNSIITKSLQDILNTVVYNIVINIVDRSNRLVFSSSVSFKKYIQYILQYTLLYISIA